MAYGGAVRLHHGPYGVVRKSTVEICKAAPEEVAE